MIDLLKFVSSRAAPVVINQGSACGLDLTNIRSLRLDREGFRLQYDIRDSDFVVVFIGRPLNRKGFGLLIRWWCDRIQDDRFKLVLCGPTKDDVESISKSQAKNIRCLGYTDEVNVVLASADILILPSLHEGLSYACLEALAQGVIVLANDIPGVRCAIEHEVTGFLIENNSFEKYEKYIRAIQANRDGFETIRAHAKQDVERFSRDAFLATYILHLKMIVRS
jgi:glycosyltransferase involved in cell wall biosynthesis